MVLVDLRNHGRSAGIKSLVPPHDMSTAAKDLADLVKARGWACPDVVVGHSMGGKVALDSTKSLLAWCIWRGSCSSQTEQLWVLDSIPGEVKTDNSDGEVERVLQTLASLPSSLPSRKVRYYWPLLEHPPKGLEIAIVQAERIDRWDPSDVQRLKALSKREMQA